MFIGDIYILLCYHVVKTAESDKESDILSLGDSMSKVREKRLTSKSGFFKMKCER